MSPAAAAGRAGDQATDARLRSLGPAGRGDGGAGLRDQTRSKAADTLQGAVQHVLGAGRRGRDEDLGPSLPKRPRGPELPAYEPIPTPPGYTIPLVKSTQAGQKLEDLSQKQAHHARILTLMQHGVAVDPALASAALASMSLSDTQSTPRKSSKDSVNPPRAEIKKFRKALEDNLSHVRSYMESHDLWEAPADEDKLKAFESFLSSAQGDEEEDESPDSVLGVPAPDDALKHVHAIYNAPRPAVEQKSRQGSSSQTKEERDPMLVSPFARVVRVWPQTYDELCSVASEMSQEDLEALGLSKERMKQLLKQSKPIAVERVAGHLQDHLRTASQAVKLASASLAYAQAVGAALESAQSQIRTMLNWTAWAEPEATLNKTLFEHSLQAVLNCCQVSAMANGAANTAAFATLDVAARGVRKAVHGIRGQHLDAMLGTPAGSDQRSNPLRQGLLYQPIRSNSLFADQVSATLATSAVRTDSLSKMIHALEDPRGPRLPLSSPVRQTNRQQPFRGGASGSQGGTRRSQGRSSSRKRKLDYGTRRGPFKEHSGYQQQYQQQQLPQQQQRQQQQQPAPRFPGAGSSTRGGHGKGKGRGKNRQ